MPFYTCCFLLAGAAGSLGLLLLAVNALLQRARTEDAG